VKKITVISVFGTRPEIIKMAPVVKELERRADIFTSHVIITGQHKEMSEPYLELFSIIPDFDLSIMEEDQTLHHITISILQRLEKLLGSVKPDILLIQGDTSSAFAAALSAYYKRIEIGHIEAGLRTYNKYNPFPEEINRHLISVLADLNFAPTQKAKDNLMGEGINKDKVFVTGNTVIDALLSIVDENYTFTHEVLKTIDFVHKKVITVTTHRRESFGKPIQDTLKAIKIIVTRFSNVEVVFPVHFNPNVRKHVYSILGGADRIHLVEPLHYESFVQLLNRSYLILTDSGGIQEECPSLGKPVLVLRETTERPEGVRAGTAKMVGTDVNKIAESVTELIENESKYAKMADSINPYGDGRAAIKIVDILERHFFH
jgi:UDP-N-acetylglucosamine 2-epimerase (non-hydrolysing)